MIDIDSTCWLDLETYGPEDLRKVGSYKYAERAEILLCSVAFGEGEPHVYDLTAGQCIPDIPTGWTICSHNSMFDRIMLVCHRSPIASMPWVDSMVLAYLCALPGGLGMLCAVLGVPQDKVKEKNGHRLVLQFSKPLGKNRRLRRATRETHPEDWEAYKKYCAMDTIAMREAVRRLPKWNLTPEIYGEWIVDQVVNDRGFAIDVDLVESAIAAAELDKLRNDEAVRVATGGYLSTAGQRDAMLNYLQAMYGVNLPSLGKAQVEQALARREIAVGARTILEARQRGSCTSTAKYDTIAQAVSYDGRMRGCFQFAGAPRTLRWAGRRFQPQNLPRPAIDQDKIEAGIERIKSGNVDGLDIPDLLKNVLRSIVVAPEGKKLVVSDLSAIEGRVLAWLAGEQWKLGAYRRYDEGKGHDLYTLTYAKTFGVSPESVTKDQRQIGKVLELALGYGGGANAFLTMAQGYGIDLAATAREVLHTIPTEIINRSRAFWSHLEEKGNTPEMDLGTFIGCDGMKNLWRAANPAIVQYWKDLERGFRAAIEGEPCDPRVDCACEWVRLVLPSGRYVPYYKARMCGTQLSYMGVDGTTKQWRRLFTYGGKLAENATQAVSRDVLASCMPRAESYGYAIVMHVHDELVTETPDEPRYNVNHLNTLLSTNPIWAPDLPLSAEGFETYRYRKG